MEESYWHKGYRINYNSIFGITEEFETGFKVIGKDRKEGLELFEKYINN